MDVATLTVRSAVTGSDDEEFFKKRDAPADTADDFSSFVNTVADEEKRKHVNHYLSEVPEEDHSRRGREERSGRGHQGHRSAGSLRTPVQHALRAGQHRVLPEVVKSEGCEG